MSLGSASGSCGGADGHVPTVLQVITDTDRRGAQVFALDLHAALKRRGQRVRTVALARGRTGGLDVPVLGRRRLSFGTLRRLTTEALSVEVVVAHGSTTLPACAMVSAFTRTPFVYRQISDSLYWARSTGRRWRVRVELTRAAHMVTLWPGARDVLVREFGVPPARVSVIPNGVPPERFSGLDAAARTAKRQRFGLDQHRLTALYLGALVPDKGVDAVIDALAHAPTIQLLVAGDGPEAARLQEQAARVAPGRVRFAGSVADPLSCFEATDVVVLASRGGDSMPAVLIEAGMLGLPCVATPIEGIPQIVLDGRTGRLVKNASPAELADAIQALAGPAGRAMGATAREHCLARFSMDVVSAQWADVLEDIRSG